jgi:hypothetical protein
MTSLEAFLDLIDRYCCSVKLAEATVSSRLFNDGKRVASLRAGSDIGIRRLHQALQWLSEHWPTDLDWPDSINRPISGSIADKCSSLCDSEALLVPHGNVSQTNTEIPDMLTSGEAGMQGRSSQPCIPVPINGEGMNGSI